MKKSYKEVTPEIIEVLKARGFTNIQFILRNSKNSRQALVEVLPRKSRDFQLNTVSLVSPEILDYVGEKSILAKYVIDMEYLS